jgi:hypothetical protein
VDNSQMARGYPQDFPHFHMYPSILKTLPHRKYPWRTRPLGIGKVCRVNDAGLMASAFFFAGDA